MAKKRLNKPVKAEVKETKPERVKVTFIKNFEGSLNNWKVNVKKGDTLEVLPFTVEWLKGHGVI